MSESNVNDGGPAFPTIDGGELSKYADHDGYHNLRIESSIGMSLRDWFAGQTLMAVLQDAIRVPDPQKSFRAYAKWSYEMADAMLKVREETK
jgi:hypothetical protein